LQSNKVRNIEVNPTPNKSLHEPPDVSVTRLAVATRAPDTGARELGVDDMGASSAGFAYNAGIAGLAFALLLVLLTH
jgi:hypothetical protein